jgi:hypothetical protein
VRQRGRDGRRHRTLDSLRWIDAGSTRARWHRVRDREDFYFLFGDATGLLARGETDDTRGTVRAATGPSCMMTTEIHTVAGSRFWSTARPYDTSPRQLWIYTDPEWDDPQRYTFAEPQ